MKEKKLGLLGLIILVIGGIIGSGIFTLPSQVTKGAGGFAIIIGFIISGIGILGLAFVYYILSVKKPEFKNGIYLYSKEGFGDLIGFSSAWIYWIAATLGNVSLATLVFGSMSYFFKIFNSNGSNLASVICVSILIWSINLLILKGVRGALLINIIVNIAKLIPIIIFILITFIFFNYKNLSFEFLGVSNLGNLYTQVKSTMIANLWAFGGLEIAVVLSGRAKKSKDVGKATIIGIIGIIIIYLLVVILSLGVMHRDTIAGLSNPSMAYILASLVGSWGTKLIIIGLIISVSGALLAWTLITIEMIYSTGKEGVMPKFLAKENKNGTPRNALIVTGIVTQGWILFSYFCNGGYTILYSLSAIATVIPYFLNTLYVVKLMIQRKFHDNETIFIKLRNYLLVAISLVYTSWMLFSVGLNYMIILSFIIGLGILLYIVVKIQKKI